MLKDELIELVEQSYPLKPFEFVERTIDFDTVKVEYEIPFEILERDPYAYERELEKAKKALFEYIEHCIEVEPGPLMSESQAWKRRFRLLLRVQKPKF